MERGDLIAGRYRLDGEIGSGGSGEVWRATEQGSDAPVALRRVRLSHLAPDERERARERLRAEAGIALLLDHPHIVSVRRLVEHGGEPWLVMSYAAAPSLAEITAGGPLPPHRAAGIGAQVAGALAYAHSPALGIVHAAVTPHNVLVGEGDHARLTGFATSRIGGDRPSAAATAYLAPEVANGLAAGPQADVFSLGATLYAAVEGRAPWGDGDLEQSLAAARKGVVAPPRAAGGLGPVLMRMLESRPRERPTAAAAAQMLADAARAEPTGERAGRRRWPWIAAVAVAAVVVAVMGLIVWPRPVPEVVEAAAPVPALGDPATADPCSLIRPEPFDRFGKTTLDPDPGNFDLCDVTISSGQDYFAARVDFAKSGTALPAGQPEERDGLTIVRGASVDGGCVHTLRLSDGYDVRVGSRSVSGVLPDPCAVADVATETALAVLVRGTVPRRPAPFDPGSLAVVDACGLLDTATVATVPGLETAKADPGFAGWGCDWEIPAPAPTPTAPPAASIVVDYDRNRGLGDNAGKPMQIAGREAAAKVDGDGLGCDVTILHRPYTDPDGKPSDELLIVKVDQASRVANPCTRAIAIATVAVERLPAAP